LAEIAADTSRTSYGADRCAEIVAAQHIAAGAPKAGKAEQPRIVWQLLIRSVNRPEDDERWVHVAVLVDIDRYRKRVNGGWIADRDEPETGDVQCGGDTGVAEEYPSNVSTMPPGVVIWPLAFPVWV
jgi:hypothetical protein